ncbi:MAG: hypothetical protein WC891_01410 [Actinomycetota bacterium]
MSPKVTKAVILTASVIIIAVILGASAWLFWKPSNRAQTGQQVAFVSRRDFPKSVTQEESAIYVMNTDGTGQTRITDNSLANSSPQWSKDGKEIVFVQKEDVYGMKGDGYGRMKLAVRGAFPQWSPDGKRIIFTRQTTTQDFHLFIMNSDGTKKRVLVTGHVTQFQWSPDGRSIAYTQGRSGPTSQAAIHVIDPDSKADITLPSPEGGDANSPCWSPDGKQIVFGSFLGEQRADIYVIDVATKETRKLDLPDDVGPWRWQPAWSSNGRQIAFLSSVNPPWSAKKESVNMAAVMADGTGARLLTNLKDWRFASDFVWADDALIFVLGEIKEKNGKKETSTNIWSVGIDGKTKRLTTTGKDSAPNWALR